jgi:hypothetical protein
MPWDRERGRVRTRGGILFDASDVVARTGQNDIGTAWERFFRQPAHRERHGNGLSSGWRLFLWRPTLSMRGASPGVEATPGDARQQSHRTNRNLSFESGTMRRGGGNL